MGGSGKYIFRPTFSQFVYNRQFLKEKVLQIFVFIYRVFFLITISVDLLYTSVYQAAAPIKVDREPYKGPVLKLCKFIFVQVL